MATIIRVDGSREELTNLSLGSLQQAVGGYIEPVRLPTGELMYIDEDGMFKGKEINQDISLLLGAIVVGDVVILSAEEEKKDEG